MLLPSQSLLHVATRRQAIGVLLLDVLVLIIYLYALVYYILRQLNNFSTTFYICIFNQQWSLILEPVLCNMMCCSLHFNSLSRRITGSKAFFLSLWVPAGYPIISIDDMNNEGTHLSTFNNIKMVLLPFLNSREVASLMACGFLLRSDCGGGIRDTPYHCQVSCPL